MTDTDQLLKDRGLLYGEFIHNAELAQAFKEALHIWADWPSKPADQREALEMMSSKIARAACGDPTYVDNWADVAGYATLVADRIRKEAK
jgi:hypothetical protein